MTIHDTDGNVYHVDQALNIQTSENPEFIFKAVKKESAFYYLELARQLYKDHHKIESLTLLKSLRILSDKTGEIIKIAQMATDEIEKIRKLEGDRFNKLDSETSVVMYTLGNKQCLLSIYGGFEFCTDGQIRVMKKTLIERYQYSRDGVLAAVYESKDSPDAYCIVSVTSEKFHYKMKTVNDYVETVRNKTVQDVFERKILKDGRFYRAYEISMSGKMNFKGFELYKLNENNGLYVKMIYPADINSIKKTQLEGIFSQISGNE